MLDALSERLQNTFRRLYLNEWTEQSERWIDMAAWHACDGPTDWRQLREQLKGTTALGLGPVVINDPTPYRRPESPPCRQTDVNS